MNKQLIVSLLFLSIPSGVIFGAESKMEVQKPRRSSRIRDKGLKRTRKCSIKELNEEVRKKKLRVVDLSLLTQEEKDIRLVQAVQENSLSLVKNLLQAGANPNTRNEQDQPLLIVIAGDWHGREFVEKNAYSKKGHEEFMENYPKMAQLLIKGGANVNIQNKKKETPLMWAVYDSYGNRFKESEYYNQELHLKWLKNCSQLVTILLQANANPNLADQTGCVPFHRVSEDQYLRNFSRLEPGYDKKMNSTYCDESNKWAQLLIEHHANLDIQDNWNRTPLIVSSSDGRISIVKMLLKHGADLTIRDINGFMPQHKAAEGNNITCFMFLLQYGADLSASTPRGDRAFTLAGSRLKIELRSLKQNGLANNQFLLACKYLNPDRVSELIKKKADVNQTDNKGMTGLMYAAFQSPDYKEGSLKAIDLLLKSGADLTRESDDGYIALESMIPEVKKKIRDHILAQNRKEVFEMVKKALIEEKAIEKGLPELILEFTGTYEND